MLNENNKQELNEYRAEVTKLVNDSQRKNSVNLSFNEEMKSLEDQLSTP